MTRSNKPSAPSQRMLRVGELVRHALAGLLQRGEVSDPVLDQTAITVPEVRMSPDLKVAKAYIMPLGGENAEEVVAALNTHQRFVRGKIAPLINLKYAPEIRFYVDDTFDEASRINALLRSEKVQRDLAADDDDEQDGETE